MVGQGDEIRSWVRIEHRCELEAGEGGRSLEEEESKGAAIPFLIFSFPPALVIPTGLTSEALTGVRGDRIKRFRPARKRTRSLC